MKPEIFPIDLQKLRKRDQLQSNEVGNCDSIFEQNRRWPSLPVTSVYWSSRSDGGEEPGYFRIQSPSKKAATVTISDQTTSHAVAEKQDSYTAAIQQVIDQAVDQAHAQMFENDPFPSAKKCAKCHPQHFREWAASPHAYAQLSPVFNAMSNKLIKLTSGTLGDFCIRCHTPVGMALDEPINVTNLCRPASSREGVTCVVCHRVNQAWAKGLVDRHWFRETSTKSFMVRL